MPARGSCRVCEGPKAAQIKALLTAGQGYGSVARVTGYPQTTIYQHAKRCMTASPAPAAPLTSLPEVDVDPGDPIAPLLADLREKHARLSEEYAKDQSPSMLAMLAVQARNNLMQQAVLIGKLQRKRDPVEVLTANPDWIASITAVAEALDGEPTAREKVRLRLEAVVGKVERLE